MLMVSMVVNNKREVGDIKIVRGEPHGKLPHHFYYSYQADDNDNHRYLGQVLHNFNSGPYALVAKVTKAIVRQQKSAKANMIKGAVL